MAEVIIVTLARSIVGKITSFTSDLLLSSITEKTKAAKSVNRYLKIIAEKLEEIIAFLADVEERQYTSNSIKIWLRNLKSVVYDIDDFLDELATDALQNRVNKGHLGRQFRYYLDSSTSLSVKLEDIVAKTSFFNLSECPLEISSDEIRDPLDRCPHIYDRSIVGRDDAKEAILTKLFDGCYGHGRRYLSVLPIVGMGGIGKTALAKLVFGDERLKSCFELRLWACVSDKFHLKNIVEDIIENGTNEKNLSSQSLNFLTRKLCELLGWKKFFLVLDDVWEDDIAKWLELKNLLTIQTPGSMILITTRSHRVASITGTVEPYNVASLPIDVCWTIFKELAFAEGEEEKYRELVRIGQLIVGKCNGIPLVVKSLGSLLRNERDEQQWKKIKDMDSFVRLHGQYEKKVVSLLKLSYNNLPSHLKPCFAHLSLFVKDAPLLSADMIHWWSALGLLQGETEIESIGYSYFSELVSRSLLHETHVVLKNLYFSKCKMHDMMHDIATNILEEELSIVTLDKMKVSQFTRHIIWGNEGSDSLKDTTFPKELSKAPNIRSFKFGYQMNQVSSSFLKGIISNFIYLRILDLGLSAFDELPNTIGNLKHLRILDLSNNCAIRSLPNSICKLLNLESFNLFRCEELKRHPDDIYLLQSLRSFVLTTCQVSLGANFNELSSLRYLNFAYCKSLASLWDDCNVGRLTSLHLLSISNCHNLTCLPKSMKFLTGLKTLVIKDCETLDLEEGESLQGLQRLQQLFISGVPKLVRLPREIRSAAASLQDLFIINCRGLQELPEWLRWFTSLSRVRISKCPNVLALPIGFNHLNNLQLLVISGAHIYQNDALYQMGKTTFQLDTFQKSSLMALHTLMPRVHKKDSNYHWPWRSVREGFKKPMLLCSEGQG